MECFAEQRPGLPAHKAIADDGHGDRPGHDEGEAGIPVSAADAGEIEKVQNLGWIGHAGQQQSKTEGETDRKLENNRHDVQPRCRAMNTVAIPVAMKVTVATS